MPNATANDHATREPGTLFDSELWWREHYQVLENRGYRLRPRYSPDWIPSWKKSGKEFYTVEDGQPTLLPTAMDATHLDGRQVMLKSVPARGQQELEIARTVSSPELRRHPRNHCVPLLDTFELPDTLDEKLIVMPFLRPFDEPRFQTYGEFVAFFTQICEGLQFMHEQNIAHRDCTANNIMLDPSGMYPNGFHPIKINRSRDFKSKPQRFDRTQRPPRYYLIDFGLSRQYSSRNALDDPLRGGDKSAPEHQSRRRCNPFQTDIYHLGNLVRERFIKRYNGFGFMKDLVDAMTAIEPSKRPMIEDVISKFAHIRESLSVAKLRSPITSSRDPSVITAFRYTSQAIRTVQYIILQKPAIPEP